MKNIISKIRKRIFGINILDLYENGSEYLNEGLLNDCVLNNPMIDYMGQKIHVIETLGHLRPIAVVILNGSNEKRIVVDKGFFRFSETIQKFFINHEIGHIHDENFKNNSETGGFELLLESSLEITADDYSFETLSKNELKEVYNKIFKPLHKFYKNRFHILMKMDLTEEERTSVKTEHKVIMDRYINILKHL